MVKIDNILIRGNLSNNLNNFNLINFLLYASKSNDFFFNMKNIINLKSDYYNSNIKIKIQQHKFVNLFEANYSGNRVINIEKKYKISSHMYLLFLENFRFSNNSIFIKDKLYDFKIKSKKTIEKDRNSLTSNSLTEFINKFYWLKRYFGQLSDRKIFFYNWFLFFYTKNLEILVKSVKYFFEKLPFKKHRYILHKTKILIRSLLSEAKKDFEFVGLFFKIKGKIGVGGNSRKKYLMYHNGYTSNSTKKLKLIRETFLIRTTTGVLNVLIRLSYK